MPDREKVIRAVETCFDSWIDKHRNMGLDLHTVEQMKRDALELLKWQEQIVRCKDCKHGAFVAQDGMLPFVTCKGEDHELDWFCADGEGR